MQTVPELGRSNGRLVGKVAIVTGGAQGIGAVYARALAAEGARVSICDLQRPTEITDSIKAAGGAAMGDCVDVCDPAALAAFVAKTEASFGAVHVLVNNAAMWGTLARKSFMEISTQEWDKVMTVNVRGPFECVKAVVPTMRRQKYGKIINIASGTAFKGTPMLLHYVTSKGAMLAFTKALARELGPDGISVNCLAPGLTLSENVKNSETLNAGAAGNIASRAFQREMYPDDLIGALLLLASPESDFITGQTLIVDGGSAMI